MKHLVLITLAIGIPCLLPTNGKAATIDSVNIKNGYLVYGASNPSPTFLSTGDFLTLYDAGAPPVNLTGDFANSGLFTITQSFTDTPAPGISPTDNPSITNIRFTYIGTNNLYDPDLGTFSLADPSGTFRYTSADATYHIADGRVNSLTTGIAPPLGPVPEPSTLVLLGTGVLGLAGAARKRLFS